MTSKPLNKIIQHKALSIVAYQLIGVLILSILVLLFAGMKNGLSSFMGGMAYGLPNLLFVWGVFRYAGAQQMHQFLAAFMAGEAFKLILSAILFLLIVKTFVVSLLFVLIGFAGAIVSFWIVCVWQFSIKQDR